ncbi:hypothetical protein BJ742DRAFT_737301 [Cladochytrium replicatum]|nr:hypothetical protein BJ742DRAFT_737301 [Cladochytrium replicatum]
MSRNLQMRRAEISPEKWLYKTQQNTRSASSGIERVEYDSEDEEELVGDAVLMGSVISVSAEVCGITNEVASLRRGTKQLLILLIVLGAVPVPTEQEIEPIFRAATVPLSYNRGHRPALEMHIVDRARELIANGTLLDVTAPDLERFLTAAWAARTVTQSSCSECRTIVADGRLLVLQLWSSRIQPPLQDSCRNFHVLCMGDLGCGVIIQACKDCPLQETATSTHDQVLFRVGTEEEAANYEAERIARGAISVQVLLSAGSRLSLGHALCFPQRRLLQGTMTLHQRFGVIYMVVLSVLSVAETGHSILEIEAVRNGIAYAVATAVWRTQAHFRKFTMFLLENLALLLQIVKAGVTRAVQRTIAKNGSWKTSKERVIS